MARRYLCQGTVPSSNVGIKSQSSLPRVTKFKSLSQIGQGNSSFKNPKPHERKLKVDSGEKVRADFGGEEGAASCA